jgi:DNA-directed RNA polymerase subunit RPC12/RpoP
MPVWICATCGNHYPDQESPPRECVICADEILEASASRYIEFLRGDAVVD